jgi:hypothetical protein
MLTKQTTIINSTLYLVSALLIVYVFSRSYLLSFTHDESLSFALIKGDNALGETANNHYINSQLMLFMSNVFGDVEWLLRIPNVISLILYVFASIQIINLFKPNNWLIFTGFVLFILNPYQLDFFSLARGYGISMGCIMVSLLYYLKNCFQEYSLKHYWIAMFFASIAVGANLSVINFYLILYLLFQLNHLKNVDYSIKAFLNTKLIVINLIFILPIYLALNRLIELSERGELYFGTDNLFDSLNSIIISSLYNNRTFDIESTTQIIGVFISFILFSSLILSIFYLIKKKDSLIVHLTFMVCTISVGILLERILFAVNYPDGRTLLYLIPLIVVWTFSTLSALVYSLRSHKMKLIISGVFFLLIIPFYTYNFAVNINWKQTFDWRYDADTKKIVLLIADDSNEHKKQQDQIIISSNWLLSPTLNYYIQLYGLKILPVSKDGLSYDANYLIEDNSITIPDENFRVLKHFSFSNFVIYKKVCDK